MAGLHQPGQPGYQPCACGAAGDNNQGSAPATATPATPSSGNAVRGGAGGNGGDNNGNVANGGSGNSGDFSGNGGIAVGDNGNGGNGGPAVGGESLQLHFADTCAGVVCTMWWPTKEAAWHVESDSHHTSFWLHSSTLYTQLNWLHDAQILLAES